MNEDDYLPPIMVGGLEVFRETIVGFERTWTIRMSTLADEHAV